MSQITVPKKDQYLVTYKQLSLYRVGEENLIEFSDFVFRLYAYHYFKKYAWYPNPEDIREMREDDKKYFKDSVYFAFKNSEGQLLGTIKATQKNNHIVFPIEHEFQIDIDTLIKERELRVENIWHLGRLAIDSAAIRKKELPITAREMMRYLLLEIFEVINGTDHPLIVAESDVLIYQMFRELGIHMQIIGDVKDCLGSPTYPVIIEGKDVKDWLDNNTKFYEGMELVY